MSKKVSKKQGALTPAKRERSSDIPDYSGSPLPPIGYVTKKFTLIDEFWRGLTTKRPKPLALPLDAKPPKVLSGSMVKLQREYLEKFEKLINYEIESQIKSVEQKMKNWDRKKLEKEGVCIFDLKAEFKGFLYKEALIHFTPNSRPEMPFHRFGVGDMVLVTNMYDTKSTLMVEGLIADKNEKGITVSTTTVLEVEQITKGTWRIDQSVNRVSHNRMTDSLKKFCSNDGQNMTQFKDLLLGLVSSVKESAQLPPPQWLSLCYHESNWPAEFDSWKLNPSQRSVIRASLQHRLSIIQGPPGTGKTHTAVHLISLLVHCLRKASKKIPILCTADTNVAVDNILEAVTDRGLRGVRVGKPVKIREELRELSLDALLMKHPDYDKLQYLKYQRDDLLKNGNTHKELTSVKQAIKFIESRMSKDIMGRVDVICATCIGACDEILEEFKFPVVLIDEGSQATEPSVMGTFIKGSEHVILLGDHFQLPPTVTSDTAVKGGLAISLFERLISEGVEPNLLSIQYRMHPAISEFPSKQFYNGKITDGISSLDRPCPKGFPWPNPNKPVSFISINNGYEEQSQDGNSKQNVEEAKIIVKLVDKFLNSGFTCKDIGVISPYNGQVSLLKSMFTAKNEDMYQKLTIHSVDGFQGREKEVIIFSTVRSNEEGQVGFLKDWRRLNVALTRPKRGVVVLGSKKTLANDSTWSNWLKWIEENKLELEENHIDDEESEHVVMEMQENREEENNSSIMEVEQEKQEEENNVQEEFVEDEKQYNSVKEDYEQNDDEEEE